MEIRRAIKTDFDQMWLIFQTVIASEDTYVFAANTNVQDAHDYWFGSGVTSYIAIDNQNIMGMYKLIANQRDLGSHVANASFMVNPSSRGMGLGRKLGLHCLSEASQAGFQAIQFNFVVSSNTAAISLWKSLGFSIVGTSPKSFKHKQLGYIDTHIMHRYL